MGIILSPCKFCGRNAQVQNEQPVDSAEHFSFRFLQSSRFSALSSHIAKLNPLFAKLQGDQTGHAGSIFTTVRFRHYIFGYKTIFTYNVGYPGESSTVTQRITEKPFHHFVVHRFVTGVDDTLQEKVRFLQLVEEKRISLRELKRTQMILVNRFGTHHVQPRKEPATSG